VLRWLAGAEEPFFLFVHYFDPHAPYSGPEALLRKIPADYARDLAAERIDAARRTHPKLKTTELARVIRNYHAEVLAVDRAVSRLLATLDTRGLGERTLVVVTADHGEGLGQRGPLGHAYQIYEEQIRVPLIFRWPGVLPGGVRLQSPVGLVDVAPTVAELTGVRFRAALDGRSIAGALRRGREPEARTLIGRRRRYDRPTPGGTGPVYFVRTPRWKYLRSEPGAEELYDLTRDAREEHDLRARHPEAAARLSVILEAHLAAHPEPAFPSSPSEATRRGLEALGYVEGGP
jgi:arylsulfatase A-like enzyme